MRHQANMILEVEDDAQLERLHKGGRLCETMVLSRIDTHPLPSPHTQASETNCARLHRVLLSAARAPVLPADIAARRDCIVGFQLNSLERPVHRSRQFSRFHRHCARSRRPRTAHPESCSERPKPTQSECPMTVMEGRRDFGVHAKFSRVASSMSSCARVSMYPSILGPRAARTVRDGLRRQHQRLRREQQPGV